MLSHQTGHEKDALSLMRLLKEQHQKGCLKFCQKNLSLELKTFCSALAPLCCSRSYTISHPGFTSSRGNRGKDACDVSMAAKFDDQFARSMTQLQ
mmetsp:Transcript_20859/g.51152  ORF Transcript_20859/g.51152 Transcript_20859/m.51152 type:complete len:95 (-) Transcript_20859:207-491(-)